MTLALADAPASTTDACAADAGAARPALPERSAPTKPSTRPRVSATVATVVVVATLIAFNLVQHLVWHAWWLGPATAVALLGFARWTGLSWAQLGLHRDQHRSGVRWGLVAVALVAVVYVVGALLPATRSAFLDARYQLGVGGALFAAFVTIPVTTIVVEEVAFRSVLWGMLARHTATVRVLMGSSALFGLWHVLPSVSLATANRGIAETVQGVGLAGAAATAIVVLAVVLFTALGGVVVGELRRRSGSVIASAGLHWATNGLGVLVGVFAWQLAA